MAESLANKIAISKTEWQRLFNIAMSLCDFLGK
jgi:hypothetical protein